MMACRLSFVVILCAWLASCAQTGAPLPPSLELPKPPSDLRAIRKGNTVALTWSEPALTTDRQSIRYLGPTLICRSAESEMTTCPNPVQTVPAPPAPSRNPAQKRQARQPTAQTATDTIPASDLSDNPNAEITYAIEAQNRNERGAGLSNRAQVPAIRTLPAPPDLAAQLTDDGIALTWTSTGEPTTQDGVQHRYRIYRRDESAGKDAIAGEISLGTAGPAHFLDAAEWEKTYLYRVTTVTILSRPGSEVQIEGDDSPVVRVVAHDILPPPAPAGLEAVYSGEGQKPFIDLIWAPVTSADLAGYNVYRSEASGNAIKLNSELVKTPAYRDAAVTQGAAYSYSVSAVDARGNESARSEPTTETAPAKD